MGTRDRQVRYTILKYMEETLKIAMTVNQSELQERRNPALYLDMEGRQSGTTDRPQYGTSRKASARMPAQHAACGQFQRQNSNGSNKN
jgi:hypothetical protein